MKTYLLILSVIIISCGENRKPAAIDPVSNAAQLDSIQYLMPTPKGYTTERFPLPPSFAPAIPFDGMEELRFAKEWANPQSEAHWTYAFVWWTRGQPLLTPDSLEKYLMSYYNGLIRVNSADRNIDINKIIPTTAKVLSVARDVRDINTYQAELRIFNYMVGEPIRLHSRIHIRYCPTAGHTAILVQISKHEFTQQVWEDLNMIGNEFTCK